jgi:hypothetical protein
LYGRKLSFISPNDPPPTGQGKKIIGNCSKYCSEKSIVLKIGIDRLAGKWDKRDRIPIGLLKIMNQES